jgi:hypothetical protein
MNSSLLRNVLYMGIVTLVVASLCLLGDSADAREGQRQDLKIMVAGGDLREDLPPPNMFGVAQAGTTWIGWLPGAYDPVTNPHSIGAGGYWDFDDRGTRSCPVEDGFQEYIKNGVYAQGWTSEDVLAQKGLYWGAEDFSDPDFSCQGNAAISGTYSAWCGVITPDPAECFRDAPGYGRNWNQWLCRTVANPTGLTYTFKSDTEAGFDFAYVIIDKEHPDSCGWSGDDADTVRCYTDVVGQATETIDLTNLPGGEPGFCVDEAYITSDYSGETVKICFVVLSDGYWDDEDGNYLTCDGAFTVDDIVVTTTGGSDTTTFETGTLEGWTACGGFSPGDYVAIRDRGSILNNDECGFDACDMSGCILTYFNPDIPGAFGTGGHYAGDMHKRAWSPAVDVSGYPPRGYVMRLTWYEDLPGPNWIFKRYWVRYVQDSDCPTGAWSEPANDGFYWSYRYKICHERTWGMSSLVPADAESVQIGLSVWNGCNTWETACTNGNDSPAIDNVMLGIFDLSYPLASIRSTDNYNDAFPEDDALGDFPSSATALIDIANNRSQEGYFMRLGDTAFVQLDEPDVKIEFCFRAVPGPGTDTSDPWFAKYGESGLAGCDTSAVHCTRMDTAFAAGDGDTSSKYETQVVFEKFYATMIHEDDPLYVAEGEEIVPDSLFTPGSKLYFAYRSSFPATPDHYGWLPFGADPTGADLSGWYEVAILPDQCKDPAACLLYVDYYNRGAQGPIEAAFVMLGRTWDRYDVRAESSHQGNGIGNRLLGPGRYRLDRGPIGPSLDHLTQYKVMIVNTGNFGSGVCLSDGGKGTPDDPTNDITFLDNWISEGTYKGLWMSGNNIASDFYYATGGSPKNGFLSRELATDLVDEDYSNAVNHPLNENCHVLVSAGGKVVNTYSTTDSMSFIGSGCPHRYDYDVLEERDGETGHEFVSLMYDDTGVTHPPGYYASVDHIFRAPNAPFDTVRTKIDGFSMHNLRMNDPSCGASDNIMVALWLRDVLGGVNNNGYFYDRDLQVQYCPPSGLEIVGLPGGGGRTARNALFQNYPNPFRGGTGTTIHYTASKVAAAEIRIFDAAGRLVKTLKDRAELGDNFVLWDGSGESGRKAPSGVYFYEIRVGGFNAHKKMLLVR